MFFIFLCKMFVKFIVCFYQRVRLLLSFNLLPLINELMLNISVCIYSCDSEYRFYIAGEVVETKG